MSRSIEEYARCDLLNDSPQSLLYGHLLDTIARLHGEVRHLRSELNKPPPDCSKCAKDIPVPEKVETPTARLQILHRVFCGSERHYHDRTIYEDEPRRRSNHYSGDMELSGDKKVPNIEQYCSEHNGISFIIFKEHQCNKNHTRIFNPIEPENDRPRISSRGERLRIVSEVLQKALNHVAQYSPQGTTTRGITEISAPYLFLYHHRVLLSEYASTSGGETGEHISVLLAFINEHYKAEYEEADRQFAAGIVTKEHIEKLYRPNDIVVVKTQFKDRAYVVKSWLEFSTAGNFQLSCWSWEYDGSFLRREETPLRIMTPLDNGSALSVIGVYPISMIDDESIVHLRQRGRKFWTTKEQYLTCYSGYDVDKTHHVSTRYVCSFHRFVDFPAEGHSKVHDRYLDILQDASMALPTPFSHCRPI